MSVDFQAYSYLQGKRLCPDCFEIYDIREGHPICKPLIMMGREPKDQLELGEDTLHRTNMTLGDFLRSEQVRKIVKEIVMADMQKVPNEIYVENAKTPVTPPAPKEIDRALNELESVIIDLDNLHDTYNKRLDSIARSEEKENAVPADPNVWETTIGGAIGGRAYRLKLILSDFVRLLSRLEI